MEPFILQEQEFFTIADWCKAYPNLLAGFSTKNGGKSEKELQSLNLAFHVNDLKETVCANRKIVADKLDFPLEKWVGAEQTHQTNIEIVTKEHAGKGAFDYESACTDTDGFFTMEKGVLLTLCYADCVPLYFFHPATGAIGIAHAGWKGTVQNIAKEMIAVFNSHHIKANEIMAVIGPSISERRYIVDDRVIAEVEKILSADEAKPYYLVSPNQYALNLQQLNKQILIKAGVSEKNIQLTNYCTSHHEDYFFSHRRDNGKTGRMMSFIGWREDVTV
ncbi:peptidoglycan editing factor PgeF [Niallia sp. 01092]|uniref:peptidoglycan editing factor PgeF n=1 Tax=unclassified Niallia TaxID=2837522 RepID=UPI003FD4489B